MRVNDQAKTIDVDGTVTVVRPDHGDKFTLKEVQQWVQGYVELIKLPGGMVMLVNEEGLPKKLPLNMAATSTAGQSIVGRVLLCPASMFK